MIWASMALRTGAMPVYTVTMYHTEHEKLLASKALAGWNISDKSVAQMLLSDLNKWGRDGCTPLDALNKCKLRGFDASFIAAATMAKLSA